MTQETVKAQFTENQLWRILEALPEHDEELNAKISGLLSNFRQTPKVYGNGLSIKEIDD